MKKLLIPVLLVFTLVSFAQNERNFKKSKNQLTPQQEAILKTKQMVLQLDLNKFQEDQILALNEVRAKNRQKLMESHRAMKEGNEQLSSDERFNMKIKMLDAQIKYQSEIKKVLEEKQFDEWRTTKKRSYSMQKRKMHGGQKQKVKNRE
jgi:hypothetical protein